MYSPRYVIALGLLLVAATAAAHGWALADGLFLDDHWHRLQFQREAWSPRFLLEATTIQPDRFIQSWWQEVPVRWDYLRPLAVLVPKLVYRLTGGGVIAWHAISVVAHLLNAAMVHHLCLRLTHRRGWSIVGALLFVVYSHSVYAVGWLAAQNTVLMTTLMLAALLCYLRASRLDLYAGARPAPRSNGLPNDASPIRLGILAACVVLWFSALLCRENAIVLPVLAAGFDLAFGGWRHLRTRWWPHLLLLTLALAFVYWRMAYADQPMPGFYVRRPDDWSYVPWLAAKLMHYLTAAVWLSPLMFGPTLRYNPLTEVPGDCLLMLVILVILGSGYYLACRRARGWWLWPMWILLAVLPVLPVMATPHSGYLPGVGFAVGMVLGPALRHEIKPVAIGRWSRPVAIWFLIATTIYVPIYRTMWRSVQSVEPLLAARVSADPPPSQATDLFFLNLPFANVYAQLFLAEAPPESTCQKNVGQVESRSLSGRNLPPPLRCHVLTHSSDVLRVDHESRLRQLDAHRFSLSIVSGRPYFSGAMGRFLIEAMRPSGPFHTGQVVKGDLFDVQIARADDQGVWELVFAFHQPLASPRYCFYLSTNQCEAARVKFWGPDHPSLDSPPVAPVPREPEVMAAARRLDGGEVVATDMLFRTLASDDEVLRSAAWDAFRSVAAPVARALAADAQDLLAGGLPDADARARLGAWWQQFVDDRTLQAVWVRRDDFTGLQRQRDALFRIRQIAARIIQTDLYLTGPPFPGPR